MVLINLPQSVKFRCEVVLILILICGGILFPGDSYAAAEKILESVKIGSFKEKSRVVLQLSSAGFYEVDDQPDDAILSIKLFDFSRGQIPLQQLVDERLIKGIRISQEEQFLQVELSLTTSQYHYRAHLFKSPPMLVIDLKSRQVTAEEKAASANKAKNPDEQAKIREPEPEAVKKLEEKSLTAVETGAKSKPETAGAEPKKPAETDIDPPATINSTVPEAPLPEKPISSELRSLSPAENKLLTDKPIAEKLESGPPVEKSVSTSAADIEADPGRELYDQGLQHYLKGELEKAMETFSRLVTLFPHSALVPKALFRYNDALARQENNGNSRNLHHLIDNYLKMVRKYSRDSDAPWALLQVGRAYESMDFDYEAEGVYQALVHQYPQSRFAAAAWYETARINYSLKRYRKALHAYQ
ncbi:MAG: tetratricopeptide repeat protein, partial [Deltaproteobacteria bacterium]|nr:tetratricopeptide repeat protein [Deltaproteobacteria bacterium]